MWKSVTLTLLVDVLNCLLIDQSFPNCYFCTLDILLLLKKNIFLFSLSQFYVGQDNVVGIATRYRLESPGIKFQWGQEFPHQTGPALEPTQPPIQWVPGLLVVKWPGCGIDHPLPSSTKVKERVEVYLYSPSRLSWVNSVYLLSQLHKWDM
jgi:hypothetical protein